MQDSAATSGGEQFMSMWQNAIWRAVTSGNVSGIAPSMILIFFHSEEFAFTDSDPTT